MQQRDTSCEIIVPLPDADMYKSWSLSTYPDIELSFSAKVEQNSYIEV